MERPLARLDQFKVLSFDCYGTLIDWEAGIAAGLAPLATRASAGAEMTEQRVLETFARLEALQEQETPRMRYADLLAEVFLRVAREWQVAVAREDAVAFGTSVGDWPPFADTVKALNYLKQHYRLVILSNVDRQSFAVSNQRLEVSFDAVYTAEEIGSYKPALRNFRYLIEHVEREFFCPISQMLHVAQSLYHDHAPANQLGLASAFIDRRHASPGAGATPEVVPAPHYHFRFDSLADLVLAHRAERC